MDLNIEKRQDYENRVELRIAVKHLPTAEDMQLIQAAIHTIQSTASKYFGEEKAKKEA